MHVVCDVFKFNETTPMVFFPMIGGFFWGQSTWYLEQSMHWKVYISFAKNIVQPSLHFRIRRLFVKLIIHWQRAWSVQATIMFHNETCNKPEPFWNLCLICLHMCPLFSTYLYRVCLYQKEIKHVLSDKLSHATIESRSFWIWRIFSKKSNRNEK